LTGKVATGKAAGDVRKKGVVVTADGVSDEDSESSEGEAIAESGLSKRRTSSASEDTDFGVSLEEDSTLPCCETTPLSCAVIVLLLLLLGGASAAYWFFYARRCGGGDACCGNNAPRLPGEVSEQTSADTTSMLELPSGYTESVLLQQAVQQVDTDMKRGATVLSSSSERCKLIEFDGYDTSDATSSSDSSA
jgi:hypothetical protein